MERHNIVSGSYEVSLKDQYGTEITAQIFPILMKKNLTCNCLTIELVLETTTFEFTPYGIRLVIHCDRCHILETFITKLYF